MNGQIGQKAVKPNRSCSSDPKSRQVKTSKVKMTKQNQQNQKQNQKQQQKQKQIKQSQINNHLAEEVEEDLDGKHRIVLRRPTRSLSLRRKQKHLKEDDDDDNDNDGKTKKKKKKTKTTQKNSQNRLAEEVEEDLDGKRRLVLRRPTRTLSLRRKQRRNHYQEDQEESAEEERAAGSAAAEKEEEQQPHNNNIAQNVSILSFTESYVKEDGDDNHDDENEHDVKHHEMYDGSRSDRGHLRRRLFFGGRRRHEEEEDEDEDLDVVGGLSGATRDGDQEEQEEDYNDCSDDYDDDYGSCCLSSSAAESSSHETGLITSIGRGVVQLEKRVTSLILSDPGDDDDVGGDNISEGRSRSAASAATTSLTSRSYRRRARRNAAYRDYEEDDSSGSLLVERTFETITTIDDNDNDNDYERSRSGGSSNNNMLLFGDHNDDDDDDLSGRSRNNRGTTRITVVDPDGRKNEDGEESRHVRSITSTTLASPDDFDDDHNDDDNENLAVNDNTEVGLEDFQRFVVTSSSSSSMPIPMTAAAQAASAAVTPTPISIRHPTHDDEQEEQEMTAEQLAMIINQSENNPSSAAIAATTGTATDTATTTNSSSHRPITEESNGKNIKNNVNANDDNEDKKKKKVPPSRTVKSPLSFISSSWKHHPREKPMQKQKQQQKKQKQQQQEQKKQKQHQQESQDDYHVVQTSLLRDGNNNNNSRDLLSSSSSSKKNDTTTNPEVFAKKKASDKSSKNRHQQRDDASEQGVNNEVPPRTKMSWIEKRRSVGSSTSSIASPTTATATKSRGRGPVEAPTSPKDAIQSPSQKKKQNVSSPSRISSTSVPNAIVSPTSSDVVEVVDPRYNKNNHPEVANNEMNVSSFSSSSTVLDLPSLAASSSYQSKMVNKKDDGTESSKKFRLDASVGESTAPSRSSRRRLSRATEVQNSNLIPTSATKISEVTSTTKNSYSDRSVAVSANKEASNVSTSSSLAFDRQSIFVHSSTLTDGNTSTTNDGMKNLILWNHSRADTIRPESITDDIERPPPPTSTVTSDNNSDNTSDNNDNNKNFNLVHTNIDKSNRNEDVQSRQFPSQNSSSSAAAASLPPPITMTRSATSSSAYSTDESIEYNVNDWASTAKKQQDVQSSNNKRNFFRFGSRSTKIPSDSTPKNRSSERPPKNSVSGRKDGSFQSKRSDKRSLSRKGQHRLMHVPPSVPCEGPLEMEIEEEEDRSRWSWKHTVKRVKVKTDEKNSTSPSRSLSEMKSPSVKKMKSPSEDSKVPPPTPRLSRPKLRQAKSFENRNSKKISPFQRVKRSLSCSRRSSRKAEADNSSVEICGLPSSSPKSQPTSKASTVRKETTAVTPTPAENLSTDQEMKEKVHTVKLESQTLDIAPAAINRSLSHRGRSTSHRGDGFRKEEKEPNSVPKSVLVPTESETENRPDPPVSTEFGFTSFGSSSVLDNLVQSAKNTVTGVQETVVGVVNDPFAVKFDLQSETTSSANDGPKPSPAKKPIPQTSRLGMDGSLITFYNDTKFYADKRKSVGDSGVRTPDTKKSTLSRHVMDHSTNSSLESYEPPSLADWQTDKYPDLRPNSSSALLPGQPDTRHKARTTTTKMMGSHRTIESHRWLPRKKVQNHAKRGSVLFSQRQKQKEQQQQQQEQKEPKEYMSPDNSREERPPPLVRISVETW